MHRVQTLAIIIATLGIAVGRADDGFEKAQKYSASRRPPKEPDIPKVDEVARMRADTYQHPFGIDDVESFVIPPEKVGDVLKFFQDSEIDPKPFGDTYEVGTVRLDLKGGVVLRYCWFWYGPREQFSFSYNGIRYKSKKPYDGKDTAFVLDELIRGWHAEAEKGAADKQIRKH